MKKSLIILMSIMLITTTISTTVCASDIDETTVSSESAVVKINNISQISNELEQFIKAENLKAQVVTMYNPEDMNNEFIVVNYYYTHTDVKSAVEKFIAESNFDESIVTINEAGSENSGLSEKITDFYEILALLSDYLEEIDVPAYMEFPIYISETEKAVQVYTQYTDYSIEEMIYNFAERKNIDTKYIIVGHNALIGPVLGDVDGDNFLNVRDCAKLASLIAENDIKNLSDMADYNRDKIVNIRDAAAMARFIAANNKIR